MTLEGWRFLAAAKILLGPTVPGHKRNSWSYFLGIARSVTAEEAAALEEPLAAAEPAPAGDRPATLPARPRRLTPVEEKNQRIIAAAKAKSEARKAAAAARAAEAEAGEGVISA
jgi:hypothetical protein